MTQMKGLVEGAPAEINFSNIIKLDNGDMVGVSLEHLHREIPVCVLKGSTFSLVKLV
jgi:hypothetical protein